MKVFHVINTLSAGGAEMHLLTLSRQLRREGVEVGVACLREHVRGSRSLRPDFEAAGVPVTLLRSNRSLDGRFLGDLVRILQRERPEVIHTHLPRADFAGSIAQLFWRQSAWVASVHGVYSTNWSGAWTLPLFDLLWRRAGRVIAISERVRDWLVDERRLAAARVRVVHYGIEADRFARPAPAATDGRVRVGSIGRLDPIKGYETLIAAMARVREQVPAATLLIAGHDPLGYGRTLQALIDTAGLGPAVRLDGFSDDVPGFLGEIDVFAFASRSEGFGQVLIEAMAAGRPVVASRIPPLTEIVVEGETGLLVPPDDPPAFARAIAWLLEHPDEARRMGGQGLERVRRTFSAERMARETMAVYRELR